MQETVQPRTAIRSDGVVFILALLAALALAYVSGFLAAVFPQYALLIRLAVYAVLTAGVYWILRRRMTSFRYVAGEEAFAVYRVLGRKEPRCTERVPWSSATGLCPYAQLMGEKGREFNQSAKKKRDSLVLIHRQNGKRQHLIISPGAELAACIRAHLEEEEKV